MDSKRERRRHARLSLERPVTLRHRGRLLPATMKNISFGGMKIVAEQSTIDFSDQLPIEVIFDLDAKHRDLSFRGCIMRVHNREQQTREIGIQFVGAANPHHQTLESYLHRALPQAS